MAQLFVSVARNSTQTVIVSRESFASLHMPAKRESTNVSQSVCSSPWKEGKKKTQQASKQEKPMLLGQRSHSFITLLFFCFFFFFFFFFFGPSLYPHPST
jgi:hypothetical protein